MYIYIHVLSRDKFGVHNYTFWCHGRSCDHVCCWVEPTSELPMGRRPKRVTFQRYVVMKQFSHVSWRRWRRSTIQQHVHKKMQTMTQQQRLHAFDDDTCCHSSSLSRQCCEAHVVIFPEGSASHTSWNYAPPNHVGTTIPVRHCVAFLVRTHGPSGSTTVTRKSRWVAPHRNLLSHGCDAPLAYKPAGDELFDHRSGPVRTLFWLAHPEHQTVRGGTFFADCRDIRFWEISNDNDDAAASTETMAHASNNSEHWRPISVPRAVRSRLLSFLRSNGTYTPDMFYDDQDFDCLQFGYYLAGVVRPRASEGAPPPTLWSGLKRMPESYVPCAGDVGIIVDNEDHFVHVLVYLDANITISRFGVADMIVVASPESVLKSYGDICGGKRILVMTVL